MLNINLLPWREEQRKGRQQGLYALLGGVVGAAVLGVLLWGYLEGTRIDNQRQRNQMLQTEINRLEAQIKEIERLEQTRQSLLDRKQVIEELQANRTLMVHLFDQLVRTMPSGVRLTAVRQQGSTLTLEGLTQSNARVSAYMRNLETSEWLHDPRLRIIESDKGEKERPDQRYKFILNVTLHGPGQGEADLQTVEEIG